MIECPTEIATAIWSTTDGRRHNKQALPKVVNNTSLSLLHMKRENLRTISDYPEGNRWVKLPSVAFTSEHENKPRS